MMGLSITNNEDANECIKLFEQQFGKAHLDFICHASFPIAFTPDLLYSLWKNFQSDVYKKPLLVPWVAVSDLLLSILCDEVGFELFEMNPRVRDILLEKLQSDSRFGHKRCEQLAYFLYTYANKMFITEESINKKLVESQILNSLSFIDPNKAIKKIVNNLKAALVNQNKLSILSISHFINISSHRVFRKALEKYPSLIKYIYGLVCWVKNDLDNAKKYMEDIENDYYLYII